MTKVLSAIGLVLVILIVGGIATCSIHSKLLTGDVATQPALDAAATASKPLLAALDAYHHRYGFFPANIEALQGQYGLPSDYVYEVVGMNRVYDSFECAARSGEFYGVIKDPGTYHQRLVVFLRECVSGYSAFVLKSPRIQTQRSVNSSVIAFAKFSSQDGRWELDWCDSRPQPGGADCRHFPMNESTMFAERDNTRRTHVLRHLGQPGSQVAPSAE
jgi:hypothetical protein